MPPGSYPGGHRLTRKRPWQSVGDHTALSIVHAVASGGAVFRWSAPKPRKVLYVDGEMPARTLQERVAALVTASEPEPPEGYLRLIAADLHDEGLPDLVSEEGQAAIEAEIGDSELLVLDNLSSLCRSGRENEANSWQPVQDFLLRLRRRGVTVLLIHHAGKGGQQRGTSRREDVLDTIIWLRRPADYQPARRAPGSRSTSRRRGASPARRWTRSRPGWRCATARHPGPCAQ